MEEKSNKEKCLHMWNWLAETGKHTTIAYFQYHYKPLPSFLCYACEEAYEDSIKGSNCNKCPITWYVDYQEETHCEDMESPYYKWQNAESIKEKKAYAQEIVTLITNTWKE